MAALLPLAFWAAVSLPAMEVVPGLNVKELVDSADLVVCGVAREATQGGRTTLRNSGREVPAQVMITDVAVESTLKGSTGLRLIRVRFLVPEGSRLGFGPLLPGQVRMFFLKTAGPDFEFVSPYYPSIVGVTGPGPSGATPLERVANALQAVLDSLHSSKVHQREAILALQRAPTPAAIQALRKALRIEDRTLQFDAAVGLLLAGDLVGLRFAEPILLADSSAASANELHNLRYGLSQGRWSDSTTSGLTKLLRSSVPANRRAAALALAEMGSATAIPLLAEALADGDEEVRFEAVRGLAKATGEYSQSTSPTASASDQQKYIDYWKNWARTRGIIK